MAYQYLKPDTIIETFKTSRSYTEGLTDRFPEYERIARNKPHSSVPKEYPKTTDGTTASIIRKTPHRIIQQLPVGRVVSDKNDWLSIVASFIYTHKIIPHANEGYALLQKCWNVIERFLTFGSCPTYTPFVENHGYFCSDLRLPYWGDIFLQPGKLSDSDSNYIFLRSWWQTNDIEKLISSQDKIAKAKRTWNTEGLRTVKDMIAAKDEKAQTPEERQRNINIKGGVELITGFQRGVGADFITFHVQSGEIVRTKKNKDPRGELPVSFAYGDIDGSNPFGRGIVDLVGALQNLMDAEMQMYQYNRALQLNPPLIKRGNFSKNKIKFAPNVIIDIGSNPDSSLEPLTIDTTALANFPNNYGLMKSQMLNLLASPDTSISADVGNPGFSKTPQGVEASRANLSVDDNYVRKQFETWFSRWSETAINIYFAEREGVEELQLNDETADALRQLEDFDQNKLSPDNKLRINYSTATEALQFRVLSSSSQRKSDEIQEAIASALLDRVLKNPQLNSQFGGPVDIDQLARKIVQVSGIDDPELVAPELTREQRAAKAEAKNKPNAFSPTFEKPSLKLDYEELPPSGQIQFAALAGINLTMEDVLQGPVINPNVPGGAAAETAIPDAQQPMTPDHVLKADQQAHDQELSKEKLEMDRTKMAHDMTIAEKKAATDDKKASQTPASSKPNAPSKPAAPSAPSAPPAPPQVPPQEDDQMLIDQLTKLGVPPEVIDQAITALHNGKSLEEIMAMLGIK